MPALRDRLQVDLADIMSDCHESLPPQQEVPRIEFEQFISDEASDPGSAILQMRSPALSKIRPAPSAIQMAFSQQVSIHR